MYYGAFQILIHITWEILLIGIQQALWSRFCLSLSSQMLPVASLWAMLSSKAVKESSEIIKVARQKWFGTLTWLPAWVYTLHTFHGIEKIKTFYSSKVSNRVLSTRHDYYFVTTTLVKIISLRSMIWTLTWTWPGEK